MKSKLVAFLCLGFALTACEANKPQEEQSTENEEITEVQTETGEQNVLSETEKAEGWKLLFDGNSGAGWHSYGQDTLSGWEIKDGELIALGLGGDLGGDIVTDEIYEDFELSLEWKISEGGNSGIFFSVVEKGFDQIYFTGPEYQLLDDVGFAEPTEDWQKAGANYGMHPAPKKNLRPVGEYNSARIVKKGAHVEHWMNGEKLLEYELWSPEWEAKVKAGKWNDFPAYGRAKAGKIGLQDHGNKCWFRNIKVKKL